MGIGRVRESRWDGQPSSTIARTGHARVAYCTSERKLSGGFLVKQDGKADLLIEVEHCGRTQHARAEPLTLGKVQRYLHVVLPSLTVVEGGATSESRFGVARP